MPFHKQLTKEINIDTQITFEQLELSPALIGSLNENGFSEATLVQSKTIPHILKGDDIFAQAKTGSGKTGSFAIPIIEKILKSNEGETYFVLSPTRELAQQTHKVFQAFGSSIGIKSVCVIGGESFDRQKEVIATSPQVIVATPGRLVDLVKQKLIDPSKCCAVVFDEADRLFDMGFQKDIEFVLNKMDKTRQLIMVSATSNQEVLTTAYKFHSHPVEIKLNTDELIVDKINHQLAMISAEEKMPYLVNLLREKENAYSIIFCNTQFMTHLVAIWLEQMGFKSKPISGRMAQNKRTRLMEEFRDRKVTVLVCTDVAARGLDIKDVELVVNYDLPNEAANYVHRIGRTGRAGTNGLAISFCAYEDCENLDEITKLIGDPIPKLDIEDTSFATDVVKKPFLDSKTLKVVDRDKRNKDRKIKNERTKTAKPKHEKVQKKVDTSMDNKTTKSSKTDRKDTRKKTFIFKSASIEKAKQAALKHFNIKDMDLLDHKILEQGKKKFFFFGPRETTYEFHVKAIYKRLLLPFLMELFKLMDLKIYIKVSYKENSLRVSFSGKDSGSLVKNRFELQNSVEELMKKYLAQKIVIPKSLKISVRTMKSSQERKPIDEKALTALATKTLAKVKETNAAITLEAMDPASRRIIHQCVNDNNGFISTSIGDGRFKKVEISLS